MHKVWEVRIGSRDDGPAACVQDLPVRGTYYIESKFKNGMRTINKKALKLAEEDGIPRPIWLGSAWVNSPYGKSER